MSTLLGIPVLMSNTPLIRPKLKLRAHTPVSDEFRSQMDAWLLDMFGTEHYVIETKNGLLVDHETLRLLRQKSANYIQHGIEP